MVLCSALGEAWLGLYDFHKQTIPQWLFLSLTNQCHNILNIRQKSQVSLTPPVLFTDTKISSTFQLKSLISIHNDVHCRLGSQWIGCWRSTFHTQSVKHWFWQTESKPSEVGLPCHPPPPQQQAGDTRVTLQRQAIGTSTHYSPGKRVSPLEDLFWRDPGYSLEGESPHRGKKESYRQPF